ncbi:MAG: LytTR family DNA-binding domain-containing protein [Cyclobacteriaceae bacterium]
MSIKCLIVDDETISRKILNRYVEKTDFLTLSHEATNGVEAANILLKEEADIDLIFLDIEMPEMTGMELMKSLDRSYQIVLTTSAEEYAVEAFEHTVIDYLVKPIEYSRFLKASIKAKENLEALKRSAEQRDDIFIKSESKLVRIAVSEINFVEALADYVIFNTTKGKFIVHYTMKGIEKRLPSSQFARVHRSFIVNTTKIEALEDMAIKILEKEIPIGASYKDSLYKNLNIL